MKRLLIASSLLFLPGCFLSGAEVGAIAGELVAQGIRSAKDETRKEIAEAVSVATTAINATNERVQTVTTQVDSKPDWFATIGSIIGVLLAGKGVEKLSGKKES